MLNKDINSRFEDWLLNPSEALDFEVKSWLDLGDVEARATIGKALIALENHGGGQLLIGYIKGVDGKLEPDLNRPADLADFNADEFNGIVKKYAEPIFHVDVSLQRHPEFGYEFPLITVHGQSKVPVRSGRDSPKLSIRCDTYYTRRPGPASEAPQNGAEWDTLLRRCVLKQREEIISVLTAFLPSAALVQTQKVSNDYQLLSDYSSDCHARWTALNESLPAEHLARIQHGHYAFSAVVVGTKKEASTKDILDAIEITRQYTGWPMFVTLHQEATKPRLVDGGLQAWLADTKYPDVGHADFWRVTQDGQFFTLRGYQEDSGAWERVIAAPGTAFEATLPIWRIGEFLLKLVDVASRLYEADFRVVVQCQWVGLKGRHLMVHNSRRYIPAYKTVQDVVTTTGEFSESEIRELLPKVVERLSVPLYEHFELFKPPETMYVEELQQMIRGGH